MIKRFFQQRWIQSLIPLVGWIYVFLVTKTLKYSVRGQEQMEEWRNSGKPVILACWHGVLIPPMYYLRNQNIYVLSSTHRDSEYLAYILRKFGWGLIKGSSKRGGTRALIEMIRKVKEGYNVAFTPDGPTGPAKKIKPGIIYLAQKTGIPIVPLGVAAYPKNNLKSWDSFMLPNFFAQASLVFGELFWVDKELTEEEINEKTAELEKILSSLDNEAGQKITARS